MSSAGLTSSVVPSLPICPLATMPSLRTFMLFSLAPWTVSGASSTSMHRATRSAATGASAGGNSERAISSDARRSWASSDRRLGRIAS